MSYSRSDIDVQGVGDDYEVRTTSGKIVWTSKEGEEHEEAGMGRI
jgi:hypothetical protein